MKLDLESKYTVILLSGSSRENIKGWIKKPYRIGLIKATNK